MRQDRGSYDREHFSPLLSRLLIPTTQGQDTLFFSVGKPTEGEQVLRTDMALSGARVKGQRDEKAG